MPRAKIMTAGGVGAPATSANAVHSINPIIAEESMLYTIAIILLVLWLLGLVTSYTVGGLIHILLVVAIVVVLLRIFSGRKPM
jgi:hypothetical protein